MKKIFAWIKKNILGIETKRRRKRSRKKHPARKKKAVKAVKKKTAPKPVKAAKKSAPRPVKKPQPKAVKKIAVRPVKVKPELKGKKQPKETLVGEITHYFGNLSVAVIKIASGRLMVGDPIRIKGHTTDLRMTIGSMQIDRKPVDMAGRGKEIGVKVPDQVRAGDLVFKPEV